MGRLGISQFDVEQAVDQLTLRGKNPTIDTIREILGRGSKTTIAKHFNEIKSQLKNNPISHGVVLPERLALAVQQLWAHMNEMTDERINQIEQQALEKRIEDQRQLECISAEKNKFSSLYAEELQKYTDVCEEFKRSNQQLTDMTALCQKLQNQLELQEKMLEESKLENKRSHELAMHMQENLEHYQQAIQKQRLEHIMQSEKLQQQWKNDLSSLEQKNTNLLSELQIHRQENSEVKIKLQYEVEQKNEYVKKIEVLSQEFNNQKNNNILLGERNQQMKILIEEHKKLQVELQEKIISAEKTLTISTHQLHQFENKINVYQDELNKIKDENRFLIQEKHELQGKLKHMEQAYLKFIDSSKDHV